MQSIAQVAWVVYCCPRAGSGFCSAAVLVQPTAAAGESTPATGAAAATAASAADAKKGAAAKGGKVQDSKAALASKARPGVDINDPT